MLFQYPEEPNLLQTEEEQLKLAYVALLFFQPEFEEHLNANFDILQDLKTNSLEVYATEHQPLLFLA